jgi:hypothetical protein
MSWNKVHIDVDGEKINAYLKHDESQLEVKNIINIGDTIQVKNKEYKVLSSSINLRDDKLNIKLAKASKSKKKEKKSDDKQTKG